MSVSAQPAIAAPSLRTGYVMLAVVVLVWGSNYPLLKTGLQYAPPLALTALRMVLGALTMFAIAYARGRLRWPPRADWPVVLSVGLMQNMVFIALITFGLQFIPAGRAVVLAYTTPIWVVPLAALLLGERLTCWRALGVSLGLVGILLMFNPSTVDWQNRNTLIGSGLILLAALIWSLGLIYMRRHVWRSEVLDLLPWQLAVGLVALIPVMLLTEDLSTVRWDGGFFWLLVASGPLASGLCVAALVFAMRALPAVSMSLTSMGVPAVGVMTSVLVLGERPTVVDLGGFLLIAAGIAVVGLGDARRQAAVKPAAL